MVDESDDLTVAYFVGAADRGGRIKALEAEVERLRADLATAQRERANYQQAMRDAVRVSLDLTRERDEARAALRSVTEPAQALVREADDAARQNYHGWTEEEAQELEHLRRAIEEVERGRE